MGEPDNFLQGVQHEKGGQDSRRSWYANKVERMIYNYLLEGRITGDIVIESDSCLESWGVDPVVFNLIFPKYKRVVVYEDRVLVEFDLAK